MAGTFPFNWNQFEPIGQDTLLHILTKIASSQEAPFPRMLQGLEVGTYPLVLLTLVFELQRSQMLLKDQKQSPLQLWNVQPMCIRKSDKLQIFKRLKTHLLVIN